MKRTAGLVPILALLPALAAPAQTPAAVKGTTFAIWVNPTDDAPTDPPFFDCLRLGETTATIDGCPGQGTVIEFPALFGSPYLSLWLALGMCGDFGLSISLIGTSFDGRPTGAPLVIGGSGATGGPLLGFSYALSGTADPQCVLTPPARSAVSPWRRDR